MSCCLLWPVVSDFIGVGMASIRKRTNKDGSISYRVDVRLKGFPPQRATFKRLTDAKKWAGQTEVAIQENRYFKTAKARKHTFSELADRYIIETLPKKSVSAQENQKAQIKWWKEQIGHYTLADVTAAHITECREKLLSEPTKRGRLLGPATVNRYLAALSHAFNIAVNEWWWLEDSPLKKVKKPAEPRRRILPLTITAALQCARQNKTCSLEQNGRLKAAVLFCYFMARNRRVPVRLQTTLLRLKSR